MTYADHLASLQGGFAERYPQSRSHLERARHVMPGGNTRSVLHLDPFPIAIARGRADELTDIDGYTYIDCAGEFSAGLYGHDDPIILEALREAMQGGLVLTAIIHEASVFGAGRLFPAPSASEE